VFFCLSRCKEEFIVDPRHSCMAIYLHQF
jgi:YHS domain-containing protein